MAPTSAPQGDFAEELAAWDCPGHAEELRSKLSSVPGPCVLDAKEENILSFSQGDWSLVERDLRCTFSGELAARLTECFREEVVDCLAVRRELINYKKLCLHLWQAGVTVEKDLRQLASFFYCDMIGDEPPLERRQRYAEISNTMNECRGAVKAIHDARYFGKAICNLPRHPASGVPFKFEELPESLEVWKPLLQARQFLGNREALDAYWAERWCRWRGEAAPEPADAEGDAEDAAAPDAAAAKPAKQRLMWRSERQLVPSALSEGGLRVLLAAVEGSGLSLPAPALRYVELVLVARGASKALAIREALKRYCAALERAAADAQDILLELRRLMDAPATETAVSAGLHLHCEKYWRTMAGITSVLPQLLQWLQPIAAARGGAERLFVSGARGAAAFVPRGFPDFLRPYRTVVARHRGAMLEEFNDRSWPRAARPNPHEETHLHACRRCERKYTKLWLHRELCFGCEQVLRSEGRCPFSERCGSRSFCPHERRCVVCEQWSCEQCRLLRGDGEDAWQLVWQVQPAVVFLDFDRTLCTTKAGASPLEGRHSVDPDLAAICTGYGRVQIVTRNSRREDIEAFLKSRDVPVCRVHSVKRMGAKSKAEVILKEMAALDSEGAVGVFADDDVRELTDPSLAPLVEEGRLQRLLFVRAGGKE